MTLARIQAGITANPASMGSFATTLTVQNLTDIAAALAALPAPVLDGPGLYAANCQGCHGPLATSTKGGATAAKIQASITTNRAGVMGAANLTALTSNQVNLIATALAPIAPPSCGSCHAVVLASLTSGRHSFHATSSGITGTIKTQFAATTSCGICHGTGYTTTTNVAATHNDGVKNIAITATGTGIRAWIPPTTAAKGQCTPSCHGRKSW
jgi:mono/diheme cytochrome c family protein